MVSEYQIMQEAVKSAHEWALKTASWPLQAGAEWAVIAQTIADDAVDHYFYMQEQLKRMA